MLVASRASSVPFSRRLLQVVLEESIVGRHFERGLVEGDVPRLERVKLLLQRLGPLIHMAVDLPGWILRFPARLDNGDLDAVLEVL